MRWATVASSRMCSPRAASSVSISEAVDVLALHRFCDRKWRGKECLLLRSGRDWVPLNGGGVTEALCPLLSAGRAGCKNSPLRFVTAIVVYVGSGH
jgi:hypothetical protein